MTTTKAAPAKPKKPLFTTTTAKTKPIQSAKRPAKAASTKPNNTTKAKANPAKTAKPDRPATRGEKKEAEQQADRQAYGKRKQRAATRSKEYHERLARVEEAEQAKVAAMPVVNRHAAGVDAGSRTHWICIDPDGDEQTCVREVPTHTDGLKAIRDWLLENHVTTVAIESTGVYWIPLCEILEAAGIEVFLVDPSYTKQVKGRPKTDRLDCKWIARLHGLGLLAAAFRPDEKIRVLRNYLRQRANLIGACSEDVQHMQKALEQMNLKLTEVLSDITGVTGQAILRAILRGVRDPKKLAKLRNNKCKNSEETIAQALTGSYQAEHLLALRQAFDAWEFHRKQIGQIDKVIEEYLAGLAKKTDLPPLPARAKGSKGKDNALPFDVRLALYELTGVDLTEIEGIGELTALAIISEIGTDMSRWPTVKHFASWLGLCPLHKKTGGKVKSSRTRAGSNRAAQALRLAASGLHRSKSGLGAFFRRMKGRLGAAKAVTATAHKLARLVYWMLKHGMEYVRQTEEQYNQQQRERMIRNLKKRARQLGLQVNEAGKADEAEVQGR
jgi:transposase